MAMARLNTTQQLKHAAEAMARRDPAVAQRRLLVIETLIKNGMVPMGLKQLETATGLAYRLLASCIEHEWFYKPDGKVWVTEAGWAAWRMSPLGER